MTKLGYGSLKVDGSVVGAHRYFYEKHKGPIPDEFDVHHLCANRSCVNPEHLELIHWQEHKKLPRQRWAKRDPQTTAEVIRLREEGHSWQAIGDMLGFGRSTAERIYWGHRESSKISLRG